MKKIKAIYILLLAYIISAIVFWGYALQMQNNTIASYEIQITNLKKNALITDGIYKEKIAEIDKQKQARTRQYVGEGATFLLIIFFAAFVVYSSLRRQKKLADQQRNFILSITHELKTPIAGVKLNLQTLKRPDLPEDKKDLLLERAVTESNRLNELCNNLLLAAQMDDKDKQFKPATIDFSMLVLKSVEAFQSRYSFPIRTKIKEDITINGDEKMLTIVVNNLIENAIKYSNNIPEVSIALDKVEENTILSVADKGVGIPDEYKKKVFQKFFRVGNENVRNTKGTGLGLYLIGEIIQLHNGTITILDNEPKGSIFEINFS